MDIETRLRARFRQNFVRTGPPKRRRSAVTVSDRETAHGQGAGYMYLDPLEETLEYLMRGAFEALATGAGFVPFGAGVRPNGDRIHLDLDPALVADPRAAIAELVSGLKTEAEARNLAIAGLAFNSVIQLEDGGSAPAVCAHLERRGGPAFDVFRPYVRDPARGLVRHEAIRRETEAEIFGSI